MHGMGIKIQPTLGNKMVENYKKPTAQPELDFLQRLSLHKNGLIFCQEWTQRVDEMLAEQLEQGQLEQRWQRNPHTAARPFALLAMGGYGRAELCPYSDIDVLFLLPASADLALQNFIETAQRDFWDAGLKISAQLLTIKELPQQLKKDFLLLTALMESRLIWGDARLLQLAQKTLRQQISPAPKRQSFIREKLRERDARHIKLGASRYQLAPHLKDSPGGLRDLQAFFWVSRALLADPAASLSSPQLLRRLESRKILWREEINRLVKIRRFFLSVRCALHALAGRAEERLTPQHQEELAERLGYQARHGRAPAERFMRHYFLMTRDMGLLWRHLMLALKPRSMAWARPDGFVLQNAMLAFPAVAANEIDASTMLRFFHTALLERRPIHPQSLSLLTRAQKNINEKARQNKEANRFFLEILCHPRGASGTLRLMSECGLLASFVPEFKRIIGLWQPGGYHAYTVDEHTLQALYILQVILAGKREADFPLATQAREHATEHRALLVALFLHDIMKGRSGNHSELGAAVAEKLAPRFGLNDAETASVVFLVRHHLLLSETAHRRDISDPDILEHCAKIIQTKPRLDTLLALTVADINAAGEGRWTDWKAVLLRRLYMALSEKLGTQTIPLAAEKLGLQQDQSRGIIATALWQIESRHDKESKTTELCCKVPDAAENFAALAGCITLLDANILKAETEALSNHEMRITFITQTQQQQSLPSETLHQLQSLLNQKAAGKLDLNARLQQKAQSPLRPPRLASLQRRVEMTKSKTENNYLIELRGQDRPGLLFDLASAVAEAGLNIQRAQIANHGERIIDIFTVHAPSGLDEKAQGIIIKKLLWVLD